MLVIYVTIKEEINLTSISICGSIQENRKFVEKRLKENVEDWKKSKRAGTFAKRIAEQEIDKNKYFKWLKIYDNERIILAVQDVSQFSRIGLKKIFKLTTNDKCRFCKDNVISSPAAEIWSQKEGTRLATTMCAG